MAVTSKVLIEAQNAINYPSPIIMYEAKGVTTIIDKLTARNHSAAAATLTVHLVNNQTSYDYSNATIVVVKTLKAGETYLFPEIVGHVLIPKNTISMIASVDGAISVRASGREIN